MLSSTVRPPLDRRTSNVIIFISAYLDNIAALRDPTSFRNVVEAEVRARTPPKRSPKDVDMTKNQDNIAHVVAIRYFRYMSQAS